MFTFWYWKIETWTLIIAAIALVQPWAIAIYRRFFKAGTVDIHETASIEIGYSAVGATIGLLGTLRSRDRDLFIKSIHLVLTKQKDAAQQHFDWVVFRSAKTIVGQIGEVSVSAPSSFMIATAQPYHYNILFADTKFNQELSPMVEKFQPSWLAYINENSQFDLLEKLSNPPLDRKTLDFLKRTHDKFSALPEYTNTADILDKVFPWESGTYKLTFHVRTASPDRHYSKSWSFTLTEDEVQTLRTNNIPIMMEEACGMQVLGRYNFIYARYI